MPRPGIFTFHLMFSVALHFAGGSAFGASPVPSGPRHCAQFSCSAAPAVSPASIAQKTRKPPPLDEIIPAERRTDFPVGYILLKCSFYQPYQDFPGRKYRQPCTGNLPYLRDIVLMKSIFSLAGGLIAVASIAFIGCAREDNAGYGTDATPVTQQSTAQTDNTSVVPNAAGSSTRLHSIVRTNAGPETGVGAATAASSGVGTATASGSTAVESRAAIQENSQSGQNAPQPSVGSSTSGNQGSSATPNSAPNR